VISHKERRILYCPLHSRASIALAGHYLSLTISWCKSALFQVPSASPATQVIPLEELGRPRVDVIVNCSGVFRDLFVNQMLLLDRAVKMAADLDEPAEMNFVRKHAIEQVGAMKTLHALWARVP